MIDKLACIILITQFYFFLNSISSGSSIIDLIAKRNQLAGIYLGKACNQARVKKAHQI
jgi:hypothetical protein